MPKRNSAKGPSSKSKTTTASYPVNERWALVVGVSEYEYKGISSLQFSHRDAEQFAQLLKMPSCGSFPENNVKLLTNQKATLSEVQKALRSFLSLPKDDDFVIIYFSGHGAPDPKRLNQHYLFTYDTNPDDIAGTALPMREIRACVAETLLANRVMVIADACHSGALLNVKSGNVGAKLLNQSLNQLTNLKKSLAWITSSQAHQVSVEDTELRHGVFTYYLLRGLEGAADGFPDMNKNKDGYVTIKELFDYVEFHVKEHTKLAQSPTPGPGSFDPNLRLAYTGEVQSKDYFEVGQLAMNLGEQLLDQERFEAAAYYFDRSYELSKALGHNYAAKLLQIRSLIACKQLEVAIEELNFLIVLLKKEDKTDNIKEVLGEALYLLGIVHLIDGKNSTAADTCLLELRNFCPEYKYISTLTHLLNIRSPHPAKLFLILVGMNDSGEGYQKLSGAINDVEAIEQAVHKRWRDKNEVIVQKLIDADASKVNISQAFEKVKTEAGPLDVFFFHFSGLGGFNLVLDDGRSMDVVIKCYGEKTKNIDPHQCLTAEEFHQLMLGLPSIQKNAAIDTKATYGLVYLVENEPTYTLLYATSADQLARELKGKKRMGLFSKALADAFENSSQGNFWEDTISFMRVYSMNQKPLLVGNSDSFFDLGSYSFSAMLSKIFSLAEIPKYSDLLLLQRFFTHITFFPELHYRLVRYFEYYGKHEQACGITNKWSLSNFDTKQLYPLLFKAYYKNKWHDKALSLLAKFQGGPNEQKVQQIGKRYRAQLKKKVHVLIVGINEGWKDAQDLAYNLEMDLKLSHQVATKEILISQDASAKNIVSAFKNGVIKSKNGPVLFYFAGSGSTIFIDNKEEIRAKDLKPKKNKQLRYYPALFSADNQLMPFSLFQELTQHGDPENIITILDIGLLEGTMRFKPSQGQLTYNFEKNNKGLVPASAKLIDLDEHFAEPPLIGSTTLIPGNITPNFGWQQSCKETHQGQGIFTQSLIKALKELSSAPLKIKDIVNWIKFQKTYYGEGHLSPRIYGDANKLFLSPDPNMDQAIDEIAQNELRRTRETLSKFEANDPSAMIELAYTQHLLGDSEGAVRSLESIKDKTIVHYPLGRILTESAQDDKEKWSYAVRELRLVDTNNHPSASYYLGKAILGLIQVEKETEVEQLWQEYAKLGFPIGRRTQVEEYLNSRDPEKQIKFSLYKAMNFERELKISEALQEFEKAASLGSIEAVEEQIRIYIARKDWEKAFSLANDIFTTSNPNSNLNNQLLTIVPNLLASSKYLSLLEEELNSKLSVLSEEEKNKDTKLAAQLKWLKEYQAFIKNNPVIV
ncbi:MAG: caspase family protein [Haliscomenobacter sp.]|uniref:caspase family protein n=1 Tax=Haliscomenobacter sp. TaxID=2717303 RepID=UPI0029AC79EB|nr:caspase family protein [Haliscomenobacter sp.]MDX2072560.1 caspase family protein [Haliscomenobacter sp.]